MQTTEKSPHQQATQPSFSLNRTLSSQILLELPHEQQQKSTVINSKTKRQINLDYYLMEYSCLSKKYHLIKSNQQSSSSLLKQIGDLILSYPRVHIKSTACKLTGETLSNGKIMKPIVMPIADGKRYAFIFQTSDYRIKDIFEYSIVDRFLIFIVDSFLPYTLSQFAKTIHKRQIQKKLKLFANQQNLNSKIDPFRCKTSLLGQINAQFQECKKYYFSKQHILQDQIRMQTKWYLRFIPDYSILIRLNTLHYRPILLLALLIYYSIREFKIIIIGYKTTRHIMSEAVIALKTAYAPIDYCYPTILSAISEEHDNYIDSPVPALICYWGEERQCIKVRQKFKEMSKQKLMPTILIDLNNLTAFNSINTEYESKILTNMNNYFLSDKKTQVIQHANQYVLSLANSKNEQLKQESILFRQSLAFHQFAYNHK